VADQPPGTWGTARPRSKQPGGNNALASTPVIDAATNMMYALAFLQNPNLAAPGNLFFRLHAVNLVTKAITKGDNLSAEAQVGGTAGPIVLEVQGKGVEQDPNHAGMVYFDPNYQFNRAALTLLNGKVYAAFAAPGDRPPFHGWVLSFDATSLKIANPPFCTTPDAAPSGARGKQGLAAEVFGRPDLA
jgi:hypothetical protein